MMVSRTHAAAVVGAAVILAALFLNTSLTAQDKVTKLTGCLVKGEGDGAGYFLINSAFDPSLQNTEAQRVTPGSVGTTGNFTNVFYWLDGDRELEKQVGHRVEIDGYMKGDVKDGDLQVDRKDNWTEVTVKSDGRTMKARVPNASIVPGKNDDQKADVFVKRLDVDHVKMLSADCSFNAY
jgi:hypothetical protein